MADLEISVDKSQLIGLIKTTDQTKQAVKLMSAEFARTGNQTAYTRSINQLVAAQNRLPAAARMSRSQIMQLGQAYRQQVTFTDQLAVAQARMNAAMATSSRGMNRTGVATQQAGYQIGDFLVQVQSGTNAFVAFGQQATQLVGILPMMGAGFMGLSQKALIGLSAGLGIAIPLVTALAAAFMRTREEAEPTESALDTLTTGISNAQRAMDIAELSASDLADKYGELGDEVAEYATRMAQMELAFAMGDFQDQARVIREVTDAFTRASIVTSEMGESTVDFSNANLKLREAFGELGPAVNTVRNAIQELQEAESIEAQMEAAENFYGVLEDLGIPLSAIPEEFARALLELDGLFIKTAEYKELLDKLANGEKTGSRSGGGGGRRDTGIGSLAQSLLTEAERIELYRTESLEKLEEFNQQELDILGGHAEARLRIEEEYQNRLRELQQSQRELQLDNYANFFGNMANIAKVGGDRTFKVVQAFSIAEGLVNSYKAFTQVLADPAFIGRPLARAAAAGSVLASGLAQVRNMRSVNSSGGGGGGGTVSAPTSAAAPAPQQVIIDGINRDSLISGDQLSKLFDRLYKENDERGIVFSVAK